VAITVAFPIFPDAEELDLVGPFEAFAVARHYGNPLALSTVAASMEPVRLRGGLRVLPDYSFETQPAPDVIIVPGGTGTQDERAWHPVVAWLAKRVDTPLIASVCTGAFLLARAGMLDGRRATTHHEELAEFREQHPEVEVIEDSRVVDEGPIVTAGGVTAGIDLGLYLVRRLFGEELAKQVANNMEYPLNLTYGSPGPLTDNWIR
jgi:transcriptional regulator GlxA family with amidase domain